MLGRWLTDADRDLIRRLRLEPPERSRRRLSVPRSGQWQWRNAAGRLKDRAGRTRQNPQHSLHTASQNMGIKPLPPQFQHHLIAP